jgi:hypothetical protein
VAVAGPAVGRRWLMLAWQSHAGSAVHNSTRLVFAMEAANHDRILSAKIGR